MRLAFLLSTIGLLTSAPAQELRLVERVPAPLAYLAVVPGAGPAGGERSGAGLETLLDDPTVRLLLAPEDDGTPEADGSLGTLRRLRDLLALSTGELELVLTGLLPRADAPALPLLLGRVRLSDDGRARLADVLADPAVAEPGREIAGQRVYTLESVSRRRPGSLFEVALVGRDLLVTNHLSSIEDVLEALEAGAVVQAPHPESLAADPTYGAAAYHALRERLADGTGGAFVHLDWRRLRGRVIGSLDAAQLLLLQGVGLLAADHAALGIRARDGALWTTILVDQPEGADGLLAVARPTPVRRLAQELPGHGLAAVAFAVEPHRLRELAPRPRPRRPGRGPVSHANPHEARAPTFHANLVGGCRRFGLDFDAQVAPRLGDGGTCRVVLLDEAQREPGIALALRARSARAARRLYEDVRDTLQRSQLPVELRGRGDRESLAFAAAFGGGASLGVVGDAIVIGMRPDVVERIAELDRGGKRRARSGPSTQSLLDRLVDARDLDAASTIAVLEVDGSELAAAGSKAVASGRHVGVILLDDDVLRVELITPL